jgi:hypothetical protein
MRRIGWVLSLSLVAAVTACGGTKASSEAKTTPAVCPPPAVVATTAVASSAVPAVAVSSATIVPSVAVATTTSPAEKRAQKLSVTRLSIARDVKGHEPVDVGTRFDSKEPRLYAFIDVANPEKAVGEVTVEFQPPKGSARGNVTLKVGESERYRTWAFTRLAKDPGQWKAVVKNERGEVLAEESFEVFAI